MKLFNKKNINILTLISFLILSIALVGCGSETSKDNKNTKEYVVATRGTFRPFTYIDDKDQLTGFDIEVLKEVEKRNPDIKFTFKTMSVDAGFIGLESGQVDLIANQIVYNEKRANKTIYTKEPNNYTSRKIIVREETNDINSIDDLRGKKVSVTAGSEIAQFLEEYNQTAEPKIDIVFTDKGATEALNLLVTGRADATLQYEVSATDAKKILGLKIKPVGSILASDPTYFALKKDDEHQILADKINNTIAQMREDGTLKQLSEKFLEKDYTIPQN